MNPYATPAASESGESPLPPPQQTRLIRPAWRDRVFGPFNRRLLMMVNLLVIGSVGFSSYYLLWRHVSGTGIYLVPACLFSAGLRLNQFLNQRLLSRASSLLLQEIPLAAGRISHLSLDGRRVRGILALSRTEIRFLPGSDEDPIFSLRVSELATVFSDPGGKELTLFLRDDRQEIFATNSPQEWQAELEKLAVSSSAQPSA